MIRQVAAVMIMKQISNPYLETEAVVKKKTLAITITIGLSFVSATVLLLVSLILAGSRPFETLYVLIAIEVIPISVVIGSRMFKAENLKYFSVTLKFIINDGSLHAEKPANLPRRALPPRKYHPSSKNCS